MHGLHIVDNVNYDTMGHAFFLEDAVETQNVIQNNLGVLTKPSYAMLNTDQTPATFWITNPHNRISGNVAAGSSHYGFWLDTPPGPKGASSACALGDGICPSVEALCPQGTTLLAFEDNVAHSNLKARRVESVQYPTPKANAAPNPNTNPNPPNLEPRVCSTG